MNITIVRAFIALRKFAIQYDQLLNQLNDLREQIGNHDTQLNLIYDAIENLSDQKSEENNWQNREKIGFIKNN